jgi:hypothetical protein
MYENGLSPADLRAVIGNNCGNGGSFLGGGNFFEAIIALAVLSMFTGNGNGGGIFGGNGNDCRAAVDQQTLIGKLDGITNGISDATYALTGAVTGGFHAAEVSACQQQAAIMAQLCAMAADSAKCCCDTQRLVERGFADTNYNMATQACETRNLIHGVARDITENANANTRAILDFLTQDKIATLTAENQTLKFAASQSNQNAVLMAAMDANKAEILRRTGAECPSPAYLVNAPTPVNFPVNSCGQVQFGGWGNGCGCGNYGNCA